MHFPHVSASSPWRRHSLWASCALVLVTANCSLTTAERLDPFGGDATFAGGWSVNGALPSSSVCQEAGIDEVRLAFVEGSRHFEYDELKFPCATGAVDSRDGDIPGLSEATYRVRWRAYCNGDRVAIGSLQAIDALADAHTNLDMEDLLIESSEPCEPPPVAP